MIALQIVLFNNAIKKRHKSSGCFYYQSSQTTHICMEVQGIMWDQNGALTRS